MEWIWIIMSIIVGMIASSKGRSFFLWLLYGLLIWPIALVHILLVKTAQQKATETAIARIAERLEEPVPVKASVPVTGAPKRTPTDAVKLPPIKPERAPPDGHDWVLDRSGTFDVRAVTKDNADGVPRQEIIATLAPGAIVRLAPQAGQVGIFEVIISINGEDQVVGSASGPSIADYATSSDTRPVTLRIVEIKRVEGAGTFLQPRVEASVWMLGEAETVPIGESIKYRGESILHKSAGRYILLYSGREASSLKNAKELVDKNPREKQNKEV